MLAHIYIFVFFCLEITTYRFAQRAENSEPGKSDKYIVYLARQREVVFKCHSGSQGLSQVGLCWCSQRRLQENHHPVTRTKKRKKSHTRSLKPSSICQRDCSEVSRNTDLILKMSWAKATAEVAKTTVLQTVQQTATWSWLQNGATLILHRLEC